VRLAKLLSFLVVVLSTVLIVLSATAQTTSRPAPGTPSPTPINMPATMTANPEATAVLNKAFMALAGGSAIKDISLTASVRQTISASEDVGTAKLAALATGEAQTILSFPSGEYAEVQANSDAGPIGSWSKPDGTSGPIARHNLFQDSAWFAPAMLVSREALAQNTIASAVAPETRSGLAVEHLTLTKSFSGLPALISAQMQHLSRVELYFDPSTWLPVSISLTMHPDRNAGYDIPVEIQYSDYRLISGIHVPFRVQ
jgi:hypothetical protein